MKENNIICSNCGAVLTEETAQIFGSVILCETCFVECTVECDDCGTRIWSDSADGDDNHVLCSSCYDRHYTNCECCGRLIHNGVLYNDDDLRKTLNLPESKIETDSYIAVQLLESKRFLDFNSIKFMAEQVKGSFSFSIHDERNNIYLVKGDSPLSILRFPKLKMIVFASTDEILYRAISGSALIEELKKGNFEEIKIAQGEILKICANGRIEKDKFAYNEYIGKNWWDYGAFTGKSSLLMDEGADYIDDLKTVANYYGHSPDAVDDLLSQGFSPFEIEEFLYEF